MSLCVCRTTCTFLWVTRRIKLETHFWEMAGRTRKRFTPSIRPRELTQCSSWIQVITTIMLWSAQLQAFVGSWAGELGPPLAGPYSLYRRVKNWYAWLEKPLASLPRQRYNTPNLNMQESPSNQVTAVFLHLVKKGSLTTCKTTGSVGTCGNSGNKSVKK